MAHNWVHKLLILVSSVLWLCSTSVNGLLTLTGNLAVVFSEEDLKDALGRPDVLTIAIGSNLVLSPQLWPSGVLEVQRQVTIENWYPGTDQVVTIDATGASRGAVVCQVAACSITVQGPNLVWLNAAMPGPPTTDFLTPVPFAISLRTNGTLTLDSMTVVSATPTGIWNSSHLVLQPFSSGWIGNLSMHCESATQILVNWTSPNQLRNIFLRPNTTDVYTGAIIMRDLLMELSQTFVCEGGFTQDVCTSISQVCSGFHAQSPLPNDTCLAGNLHNACMPPSPLNPPQSPLSTSEKDKDSQKRMIIGLTVGLGLGIPLIVVAAVIQWRVYSNSRSKHSGLPKTDKRNVLGWLPCFSRQAPDAEPAQMEPVDTLKLAAVHIDLETGGRSDVQSYILGDQTPVTPTQPSSAVPSSVLAILGSKEALNLMYTSDTAVPVGWEADSAIHTAPGAGAYPPANRTLSATQPFSGATTTSGSRHQPHVVAGTQNSMTAGGAPILQPNSFASQQPCDSTISSYGVANNQHAPYINIGVEHGPDSFTGFSYNSEIAEGMLMVDSTATSINAPQASTSSAVMPRRPAGQQGVVIDMVPSTAGTPQLARNPLNVKLITLLGTGSSSTVYAGEWEGQQVAVKVIKQEVSEQVDLDAILQFREAALGVGLQHPRVVKTLAHALVIPEGLCNDGGILLKPGLVEAHIVSSLCELGTLKAWLQQAWRYSNLTSSLSQQHSSVHASQNAVLQSQRMAEASQRVAGDLPPMLSRGDTAQQNSGDLVVAPHPKQSTAHTQSGNQQQAGGSVATETTAGATLPPAAVAQGVVHVQPGTGPTGPQVVPGQLELSPFQNASLVPPALSQLQNDTQTPSNSSGVAVASQSSLSVTQPPSVFPPLACMPVWESTGLRLHTSFVCHLISVIDILLEVVDGLSYLLSKGVVHGDLKPQNCLRCTDNNGMRGFSIKICDFGISRVIHGSRTHTTVSSPPGTLAYFAPELLTTCHMSPACDLYSFGIIMHELLACRQPLATLSMAQVLYKKAMGKLDDLLVYPSSTPAAYQQLARECYSLHVAARPSLTNVLTGLRSIRRIAINDWPLYPNVNPPAEPIIDMTNQSAMTAASTCY